MDKLVSPTGGAEAPGPMKSQQQQAQEDAQEQRQRQEDFKNQVLNQVLDQQARARLSTLSLAKPEKAEAVTGILINMARMGRLGMGSKVNEAQLIDLLEKIGSTGGGASLASGKSERVNFTRRALDDDDEDDYAKIMEDL